MGNDVFPSGELCALCYGKWIVVTGTSEKVDECKGRKTPATGARCWKAELQKDELRLDLPVIRTSLLPAQWSSACCAIGTPVTLTINPLPLLALSSLKKFANQYSVHQK